MKRIFVILVMLVSLNASSQWVHQYTGTTSSFHHIAFINKYTGWACGDGVIMKTTNSGTNWNTQSHQATDKFLWSIFPVDSNVVYCVGYFRTILKTTNSGNNWITIRNGPWGTGPSFLTAYFLNKDTGWISGSGFTILRTLDGCNTFDSILTNPSSFIYDIRFKDAMTGIMCGITGLIKKTSNSGFNWYDVNIPLHGVLSDFYKMSVYQNNFCFLAGGDGRIFSSSDFGSNWDSVGKIQNLGQNKLYCCNFVNRYTGWAGGEFGELHKTTDGGHSWRNENTNNDQTFNAAIWFYDTLNGWAAGGGGKILNTSTGGTSSFINPVSTETPSKYSLSQNYPNPFNPTTKIKFSIIKTGQVKLIVYDIIGREVRTLVNESLKPGTYEAAFDGSALNSGVYFYKLMTDGYTETKKMLMIK